MLLILLKSRGMPVVVETHFGSKQSGDGLNGNAISLGHLCFTNTRAEVSNQFREQVVLQHFRSACGRYPLLSRPGYRRADIDANLGGSSGGRVPRSQESQEPCLTYILAPCRHRFDMLQPERSALDLRISLPKGQPVRKQPQDQRQVSQRVCVSPWSEYPAIKLQRSLALRSWQAC